MSERVKSYLSIWHISMQQVLVIFGNEYYIQQYRSWFHSFLKQQNYFFKWTFILRSKLQNKIPKPLSFNGEEGPRVPYSQPSLYS